MSLFGRFCVQILEFEEFLFVDFSLVDLPVTRIEKAKGAFKPGRLN